MRDEYKNFLLNANYGLKTTSRLEETSSFCRVSNKTTEHSQTLAAAYCCCSLFLLIALPAIFFPIFPKSLFGQSVFPKLKRIC